MAGSVLCPLRSLPYGLCSSSQTLRKEFSTERNCVCLKPLASPTNTYKTRVLNAARFPTLLRCPRRTGSAVRGNAGPGALGRPLVPSPALRPLLLCVPSCSVSPPALCLAQPGRAQRRACLTYLRAPTPLRHRAAASRREAGGKRRSLPLGIPASFKGRVIGTENGHRFFLPAGREAPSNAWV